MGINYAKKNILDTIGNTPLVELPGFRTKKGVRIFAKLEGANPTGSLKDRIAKYMIEQAEANGVLTHEKVILEPTSGNTGISLAMIAKIKNYKLKVVIPENVSLERVHLLRAFGADIVFSDGTKGTNGSIVLAQEMAKKDSRYFMPYQYGNEANPKAHYETTGEEILQALPDTDVFIAGLGTGGTLMGVGRKLKEHNPKVRLVAVVPHPDDIIQGLRNLDEGFIPPIIDVSFLDSRILIESKEAFQSTKDLLNQEGIFAGISSGAVLSCAIKVARQMDKGNIVCLFADGGWKYLSTRLWDTEYKEIEQEVKGKIWW